MNRTRAIGVGALVGVIVLLGGLWGGSHLWTGYKMKQFVAKVEKENPGVRLSWESYYLEPWSLSYVITNLVYNHNLKNIDVKMKKVKVGVFCDFNHTVSRSCTSEMQGISVAGKDPEVQKLLAQMQDKLGMPMDINVKLAQKYNPEKNFAHDMNMRIWQKDLFNSNVETAIEGLDLEALTESLRGVLAQSGSDLKNNAGGLIFMYLALLGNTQVKNISGIS